jgi:hypothetical protein
VFATATICLVFSGVASDIVRGSRLDGVGQTETKLDQLAGNIAVHFTQHYRR